MEQRIVNAEKQILDLNKAIESNNLHLDEDQYLIFKVGDDNMAVEIIRVKEIISYEEVTVVPHVPPFIAGVINLRGSIIPIIDMGRRFGRTGGEITRLTCFIVVELEQDDETTLSFGMLVDAVSEVLPIARENIEESPTFGARIRSDFISGIGKADDKFYIILNLNKVVDIKEIEIYQEKVFADM